MSGQLPGYEGNEVSMTSLRGFPPSRIVLRRLRPARRASRKTGPRTWMAVLALVLALLPSMAAAQSLTVSNLTATTATLTLSNWSEAWSYKDGQKGHYISCTNVAAGTSEVSLSGLTPGREYLVDAYNAHNCPITGNPYPRLDSVTFTALLHKVEGVSVTADGASLTVGWTARSNVTGYHVQWKSGTEDWSSDRQSDATTTSATISNLTGGASYSVRVRSYHSNYLGRIKYGEWSDTATATAPAQGSETLAASDVEHDTATLTIANYAGNWYYKANAGPHASCSSNAVSTSAASLTGLSGNTSYTYKAYSDSGCTTANLLATASVFLTKPAKPGTPTVSSGVGIGKLALSSSVTSGSGALRQWEYKWKDDPGNAESNWTIIPVQHFDHPAPYTVSGLDNTKSYQFKVRAVNATGTGPESNASDASVAVGAAARDATPDRDPADAEGERADVDDDDNDDQRTTPGTGGTASATTMPIAWRLLERR